MIQRLIRMLRSLSTETPVQEEEVSVTIDDTVEGARTTFSKDRVRKILEKSGLLDEQITAQSDDTNPNSES